MPIENLCGEVGARRHNKHDESHIEKSSYKPFSCSGPRAQQRPNGLTAFGQKLYELARFHDHRFSSPRAATVICKGSVTGSFCVLIGTAIAAAAVIGFKGQGRQWSRCISPDV